jgi:hypothetical protein
VEFFFDAGFAVSCAVFRRVLSCTGWSFFLTHGLRCSAQGFAGFGVVLDEVFFLTQGLQLYWVELFFDAGFAVFCAGFRRVLICTEWSIFLTQGLRCSAQCFAGF